MRGAFKAMVALGLAIAVPAQAQAQAQACIDRDTLTAARLAEFGTMMMTVSLRCKAIGIDISRGYEAMLGTHRPVLAAADRRLRAFFAGKSRAFDAYSTRLGNRYGGGATDPANCTRFERVARDLGANPGAAALGKVVFAMIGQPRIEGPACPKP
ncbi:hypothetical protein [Novosphingobium sp. CECT 9465]|uniref:hypothetical protein n=1 Tax=Novosphingobium sp. CECT 9465 TaxID=2829794 RepID=UPI001E35C203|nr:hypothetical protein [Novosphingobium sp. CECT 9465]CAH0495864.1 hypothetical protein NVSP9465_00885 [Novosphingobium sp. CECT 9465]